MISFEGRNQILKQPDVIARKAHNIYPHLSMSRIECLIGTDFYKKQLSNNLRMNVWSRLSSMRDKMFGAKNEMPVVIEALKNKKVGNCYEEAKLAEIIGRVNGRNDINTGRIFFSRCGSKERTLDHVVAFITAKDISSKNIFSMKNKEGIVIDPWLNVADFASEYFTKLKTVFKPFFDRLPYNIEDITFRIEPYLDEKVDNKLIDELKQKFPELILKK
jgi:hypothetical protein